MAIEFSEEQDAVTAREATNIFREIIGDPNLKEGIFQNLASSGEIAPVGVTKQNHRLYPRSEVVRLAQERASLNDLLSVNQVVERAAKRGISVKIREVQRWAEDGRLPIARKFGKLNFFKAEEADKAINAAKKKIKMAEQIKGLRNPRQSVVWINARLEAMGREERIDLRRFYSWCREERKVIEPDYKMPNGKRGNHRLFYFSEETLAQAPVFKTGPESMAEKPDPVHVTSSKVLVQLEQKWGELVIREGIREQGLSVYAVNKKDREVHPVGICGPVQWFPVRYIPEKLRRRRAFKDIYRDEVVGDDE